MGPVGPTESESIIFLVIAACFFIACGALAWNCVEFIYSHLPIRWAR
jgi:hypothetical protein